MAGLRDFLDRLLAFQTSECVYVKASGECEPYLTSLALEATSTLYVCPQADNFSMKFVEFDVWLTNNCILLSDVQVEFQTPSVLLVLLIRLENEARLVLKDEATGARQEFSARSAPAAFHVDFLGYGLILDVPSYRCFGASDFNFLSASAPYQAGVILLNHEFRQKRFQNAAQVLKRFDSACLQQFVQYMSLPLCRNFGLFYAAVCISCGALLLSDYDQLLADAVYDHRDAVCMQALDTEANYAISSTLNGPSLLSFFPQSPIAKSSYARLCEHPDCDQRLLSAPYYDIMRTIAAESDALNAVFCRYFTQKDDLYLAGALILLSENEAFAGQHLEAFLTISRLSGLPAHLPRELARVFERHFGFFASRGAGVLESGVFLLYKAGNVGIGSEFQARYPFLRATHGCQREEALDNAGERFRALSCDPCPVCLGQVYEVATLGCSHRLCAQCLREVDKCPICRGEIESFTYQEVVFR